jgi:hypothetical protein
MRDSSSAWRELADGRTQLVVWRRVPGAEGNWNELTFTAPSEAGCEAQYVAYCEEGYEASVRRAGARANHGIKSYLREGARLPAPPTRSFSTAAISQESTAAPPARSLQPSS